VATASPPCRASAANSTTAAAPAWPASAAAPARPVPAAASKAGPVIAGLPDRTGHRAAPRPPARRALTPHQLEIFLVLEHRTEGAIGTGLVEPLGAPCAAPRPSPATRRSPAA
jgi:hypothetical protein